MTRFIHHLIWFIGLIVLQVFVLDNVHFLGVFLPLAYVYALLRWPSDMPSNSILIAGFLLGLSIDVFSNTPGMHASATTWMAALRNPVLRLFVSKEDLGNDDAINEKTLGFSAFWKYTFVLVLIHHTSLFLLESFSFVHWLLLLKKILICSLLSMLFIFAFERINGKEDAKS